MAHTTDRRIRGRKLQAIRRAHFARNPLCVRCLAKGLTKLATQLDHVKALANDGEDSLDPFKNRQGLCDACHAEKTAEDLGYQLRPAIGLDGYPA